MTAVRIPAGDTRPECVLRAVDVHLSFGATPALQGARLSVARGEILAVMGPSGSGKSTLLHCLAGIFPPDSGEVWFDGRRLDTLSDAQRTRLRRTAFGFVFQFGQLVPELSAADNIALPLLLGGTRRKAAYARAAAWGPGGRGSCPAARPSGSRSPGPWWPGRRSCSPTSPPGHSTR
jgi:putative ABC transport system ATP-binding protein